MNVTEVKRLTDPWAGDARLYKLSEIVESNPTLEWKTFKVGHIIVSANEGQTYIFPAAAEGYPLDMVHLKGSINGEEDHAKAISGFLSYHVAWNPETTH